jgi:hypothetical protein
LHAQDSEIWGDVSVYKNVSSKFSLFGDAGPRLNITNGQYNGLYIRPSASYKFSNHISANGGVAWFYSNTNGVSVNEFRGWQGTRLEWKVLRRVMLSNYIRLEERWFFDPGYLKFLLRFRYLAGITIPLNNKTMEAKTWYLPFAFEVFKDLNVHENFINRTRAYVGMGYVLNNNTRMEFFYIGNRSRIIDGEFDLINVFRVRLHFTIPDKPVLID